MSSAGGKGYSMYLTTHVTHLIYGYMAWDIGLRMPPVKGNYMGYLFRPAAHPTDRIVHTMTFVTPLVQHFVSNALMN